VILKKNCSGDEYDAYANAIAKAIASVQLEVLNRVMASHPSLERELEINIEKYDRYL
jgi:hypothetical protein